VRAVPRWRTNPQYNKETMPQTLHAFGIGYQHFASLGGLRGKARSVPATTNAFWGNPGFHNFADYAMSAAFRAGIDELRQAASGRRSAIMCAETLWWRCHRRIIADYLIAAGETVFHILSADRVEPARMTEAAKTCGDGSLMYGA